MSDEMIKITPKSVDGMINVRRTDRKKTDNSNKKQISKKQSIKPVFFYENIMALILAPLKSMN
ncbi:hypothetical protein WCU84_01405 [Dickeya chrysanthemi]|uniref:Uncharacterized protein n=1 Tax=Dickeya chrysanthemi TaxID=556 RepID=A0ABU8JH99_DICCH